MYMSKCLVPTERSYQEEYSYENIIALSLIVEKI